jgi:hypothetical protein
MHVWAKKMSASVPQWVPRDQRIPVEVILNRGKIASQESKIARKAAGMTDGWVPIHDNHAIDVMAASVAFSEPIPDRLLKSVLKASEGVAIAVGLKSRHLARGVQFTVGPAGVAPIGSPPVVGYVFNAIMPGSDEVGPSSRISEQLRVEQAQIAYRTWNYVSWSWQIERMKALMLPALAAVQDAVSFSAMRLEYLDRFRFAGIANEADFTTLIRRNSPLVAPHIFSRSDLWHSYTGAFLPSKDTRKRLQQVHIDVVDDPAEVISGIPQVRWANIMTAREDRIRSEGIDDPAQNPDLTLEEFSGYHLELKEMLAEVITDDLAQRIYLLDK